MTNVRQYLTAFFAAISRLEGRMGTDIREILTLWMCADCSTFLCIFRHFFALFGTSFTFRVFYASRANGEVACHSQEQLKPCVAVFSIFSLVTSGNKDMTKPQMSTCAVISCTGSVGRPAPNIMVIRQISW